MKARTMNIKYYEFDYRPALIVDEQYSYCILDWDVGWAPMKWASTVEIQQTEWPIALEELQKRYDGQVPPIQLAVEDHPEYQQGK